MDALLKPRRSHSRVTFLACRAGARDHEIASQRHVAERLAALLGCAFAEAPDETGSLRGPIGYAVPNDTLDSIERAHALGIHGEDDLYGGVVPHPFVATKAITHPLVGSDAVGPAGWQPRFAEHVRDVVLPGFSAFSIDDARSAGRRLLQGGDVRVKLASGIGGAGQSVARNEAELDAQIGALGAAVLAQHGVVLERNLAELRTHSVGVLQFGGQRTSYFGTQRTTRNRHGHEVYGGSSLTLARGGLDGLARLTTDVHRSDVALPIGATLYYSGVDPHLGPIVKYAEVHGDARA